MSNIKRHWLCLSESQRRRCSGRPGNVSKVLETGFAKAERAGLLRKGESRQIIRLLEQEVRRGYWPHVEFDWTDAVRTAGELRAEHSLKMVVRAMDLFHIAIAIEVGADALLSFDTDQIALAQVSGLTVMKLAQKPK